MACLTNYKEHVGVQLLYWDPEQCAWVEISADFFDVNESGEAYVEDIRKALSYAMDWALGIGDFFQDAGSFHLGDRKVVIEEVPF